jgi:hypothetical protein
MGWSFSISSSDMSKSEQQKAFDMLAEISLAHQNAMADYYEEEQIKKEINKKKQIKLKEEQEIKKKCDEQRQKAILEEQEMMERIKKREKNINWALKNKRC